MRRISTGLLVLIASVTFATDHNNIESGRPLNFDDAYSIAYRSFEFQNGIGLDIFSHQRPVYRLHSEVQYGFAKNKDLSFGFEPSYSADSKKVSANRVEIGYFEGVSREIGNSPAFGYRVDVALPGDSSSRGAQVRLRGAFTKAAHQYDKLHLNVDLNINSAPNPGERSTTIGAILGYSNPVGYPKEFNRTFLAEFGVQQSVLDAGGWNGWLGVGLRRQVSTTGVVDLGVQSDLFVGKGVNRSPARLTFGYSVSF